MNGILRKQYTALAGLADDLGVAFTTPDGSYNQKFCELCRLIVVDLGGTFSPVSGSFTVRKASYLRQVANAIGITTTEAGTSFRETFLKSAQAIHANGNDGTFPDFGASLDWRVYQYLTHAVGWTPLSLSPLQWLDTYIPPHAMTDASPNELDAYYDDSGELYINQLATNTEFLGIDFWSADGANYDQKTATQLFAHKNFDQNIIVVATASSDILGVLTWERSKEWTVAQFESMTTWLTARGSAVDILEPLIDSDGEYITDSAGFLVFPFGG